MRSRTVLTLAALLGTTTFACSPRRSAADPPAAQEVSSLPVNDTPPTMMGGMMGQMGGTGGVMGRMAGGSMQGDSSPAPAAVAIECPPVGAALVKQGKSIFSGKGNCVSCHGGGAQGTALAPPLHAHRWLNIDGSYESIAALVVTGVARPKQHPAPMPPRGGASLDTGEVCAVAAYVYSLSH